MRFWKHTTWVYNEKKVRKGKSQRVFQRHLLGNLHYLHHSTFNYFFLWSSVNLQWKKIPVKAYYFRPRPFISPDEISRSPSGFKIKCWAVSTDRWLTFRQLNRYTYLHLLSGKGKHCEQTCMPETMMFSKSVRAANLIHGQHGWLWTNRCNSERRLEQGHFLLLEDSICGKFQIEGRHLLRVHVSGRLVHDNYFIGAQHGAREAHQLALPRREVGATFRHVEIQRRHCVFQFHLWQIAQLYAAVSF